MGAGAVFLLLAVTMFVSGCDREPASAPAPGPPEPTAVVTLRAPRGEIDVQPQEFSWVAVPGAVSYRARIADADAVWPLFVKSTSDTSLLLGPDEASAITPGRIHAWHVDALNEQGIVIASGNTQFRVPPPGVTP